MPGSPCLVSDVMTRTVLALCEGTAFEDIADARTECTGGAGSVV